MHDFLRKYTTISSKVSKIHDFLQLIVLKCTFFFFCINLVLFRLISTKSRKKLSQKFSSVTRKLVNFSEIGNFHFIKAKNFWKTENFSRWEYPTLEILFNGISKFWAQILSSCPEIQALVYAIYFGSHINAAVQMLSFYKFCVICVNFIAWL